MTVNLDLTGLKLEDALTRIRCSVCRLEDSIKKNKKESLALDKLLRDSSWSLPALSREFAEQGIRVSVRSLERHVGGLCNGRLGKGHLRGKP